MNNPNPYQSPRSAIAPTAPTQFGEINLLSAQGRLGRVRYIGYSVGIGLLVNVIAAIVGGVAAVLQGGGEAVGWLAGGVIIMLTVAALAISILLAIQRLHDFDASGWWSVLIVIPLANLVLYLVLLMMPGGQGRNRFGNPPPPNTTGVILLALIVPLIAVIGIIAAIAIPAYQDYAARPREVAPSSTPAQQ
ncbi:MAG TPA: DUF805 domain-containing protein [Candidatus Competibacteraceae bacterium]|nr:DUF805 domain-containing protein [Candidatus Competibacteraceae bacterium]HRZ07660.1 DUF805 domain-containing protein [Candidatus Competibacteraceae bacterium]